MRNRSYRRHQERRTKDRVRRVLRTWNRWSWDSERPPEPGAREVGIHAHHGLIRCQHVHCHNPRRHFGAPSIQELRAEPAPDEDHAAMAWRGRRY
jgi:hypothetical protein